MVRLEDEDGVDGPFNRAWAADRRVMPYRIGATVEWTSQSAGIVKTKRGVVVEIVERGRVPKISGKPGLQRDHTSYVVKVGSRRYWPRVMHLMEVSL